jgi:SusD family.
MLLSGLLFVSCDKYLDVKPKGKRLLETTADFDAWLNNVTSIAQYIPNELNQLNDNLDLPNIKNPPSTVNEWIYTWRRQYADETASPPVIWKEFYESNYYFNTVLQDIDDASGGTPRQKKSLKAEALLGRAFNYLYLVNLYGKSYHAGTAGEDLSVPFVTSNDLNTPTPSRSSVQEIYDHIIADVTEALPNLPQDNSKNRFRGAVAAGYSVLARTYLYMGDYLNAAKNAQLALDNGTDEVLDYAALPSAAGIKELVTRPGTIYARLFKTTYTQLTPTLDFLKSFDVKDLRLAYYYTSLNDYSFNKRGEVYHLGIGVAYSNAFPNCGTSVEEMRLILAECAARADDLPKAINELHLLRQARFRAADYQKFESTDKEEILQKILTERSFEFAFNGMRWFDMRRLDAEGRMPDVNRYDGQGNLVATLPQHSPRYVLQIPIQVMYFNPGWPQNPWTE